MAIMTDNDARRPPWAISTEVVGEDSDGNLTTAHYSAPNAEATLVRFDTRDEVGATCVQAWVGDTPALSERIDVAQLRALAFDLLSLVDTLERQIERACNELSKVEA